MPRDHLLEDYRAAEALADGNLRERFRLSLVLSALENLVKHDTDPAFKAAARARYVDLTDGRAPQ